jgi:hypothetical protein
MKSLGKRDDFIFDETTGLYLPKETERTDSPQRQDCFGDAPIKVEVDRDWPQLGVSVLTLILLIFTVVYARKQWLESNRAANSSEIAANAAASAAKIANDTLLEMKTGSTTTDTHTLAEQAKKQADETKELAYGAITQARATKDLADQARRTADAAISANSNAVSLQRPWVGLASLEIVSSRVVATTDEKFSLDFDINIKNFGSEAARDAVPAMRWTSNLDLIPAKMDLACSIGTDSSRSHLYGGLIFPGTDIVSYPTQLSRSEVDPAPTNYSKHLYAAICIVYQGAGDTIHHTRMCQHLLENLCFNQCGFNSAD